VHWYKKSQNDDDDILDLSPLLTDKFEEDLGDVALEMHEIIKEKMDSGEWGVLGVEHFIPRPGTWISSETPNESIMKAIDLYGDFPVVLKWAIKKREVIPASEYVRRRESGEFDPQETPELLTKLYEERHKLEALGPKGLLNPDIKDRIEQINKQIIKFPTQDYLREVFVHMDFQPMSDYDENVVDFQQERARSGDIESKTFSS